MEYQVVTLNGMKLRYELGGHEFRYFAVLVKLGEGHFEAIINSIDKFEAKLEYYEGAYNNDLELKAYPQIKIVNYAFANDFYEIQRTFYPEIKE